MYELRLATVKQMFIGYSGSNRSVFYLYRATSAGFSSIPCYAHVCLIKICGLCMVMSAPCNYSDPCLQNYIKDYGCTHVLCIAHVTRCERYSPTPNTANFPNSPESENGKMTIIISTLSLSFAKLVRQSDFLHYFSRHDSDGNLRMSRQTQCVIESPFVHSFFVIRTGAMHESREVQSTSFVKRSPHIQAGCLHYDNTLK